ncbi:MAG TPA: hemerythrin domain-containing protein [Thermoplasmata archaeon]|nr:hemerythrin domain-containing protein [Thermoplasmata archaeon]
MTVAVRGVSSPGPDQAGVASEPFRALAAQHAALRGEFARLIAAPPSEVRHPAVSALVVNLARSLERHLCIEETAVYPICERLFGGREGATNVLRGEHSSMRAQLGRLAQPVLHDGAAWRLGFESLRLSVDYHFGREERVLFPMAWALLSEPERSALARRLSAFPGR